MSRDHSLNLRGHNTLETNCYNGIHHNSITGLQSDFQFPDCIHRRDNFNSATGDKPCNVKKSFEKLVKEEIVMQTEQALDPLQFAYRAHRGVNDAIITY